MRKIMVIVFNMYGPFPGLDVISSRLKQLYDSSSASQQTVHGSARDKGCLLTVVIDMPRPDANDCLTLMDSVVEVASSTGARALPIEVLDATDNNDKLVGWIGPVVRYTIVNGEMSLI